MSVAVKESYTAVVERDSLWQDVFETEPYETAWATEAIFFVRALEGSVPENSVGRVQISPDGMHWCNEGTNITLPTQTDEVTFCRVKHFGGWLRLVGELPEGGSMKVIVYLSLKA